MANDLLFGSNGRLKVSKGIKTLCDAVKVTLGPKGRNVLIEQDFGAPLIVNDGVTIAKSITLKDKYENLGASLIIEAASKTNDTAGDGTTTAVILSSNLILNGLKKLDEGCLPTDIREGFDYYLPIIIDKIKQRSEPIKNVDDLIKVASISSGSKEIGMLIGSAYNEVGPDGEVQVEESRGIETSLDIVKGYSYDRGMASPYLASSPEKQIAELTDTDILVTDKKISSMKEILPFLENSMKSGRPLLIVCDDIEQEVLSAVVMNKLRGAFNVVITKAPSFGDRKAQLLNDIAVVSGAHLVSTLRKEELASSSLEVLGKASKVTVTSNKTVIVDGGGLDQTISDYVLNLKNLYDNETSSYEKEKYRERIAKICGGVAVIKVGAATEVELKEKKLRIEDALCSSKAAMQAGTVEGGGKVFYEISNELDEYHEYEASKEIIQAALKSLFYQIVENCGMSIEEVLPNLNNSLWFDAANKKYVNLRDNGIIDPASVEISAITNSISISGIVLTTECVIIKEEEKTCCGGHEE